MKKVYEKPRILFENFGLSESIATACDDTLGWILRGNQDLQNCYMQTDSTGVDNLRTYISNSNCDIKNIDGFCYTNHDDTWLVQTGSY